MTADAAPRLDTLYERADLSSFDLPDVLRTAYDGGLGFDGPVLYANFVSTIDGVVAMGQDVKPSVIAGKCSADRFVMGLLRACADAVLVGAGTLRAEPRHLWTAGHIDPDHAEAYAELRRTLSARPEPELFVLTSSGEIDPDAPAFQRGAVVVTGQPGEERLRHRLPDASALVVLPDRLEASASAIVDAIRERGHRRILCEGGPNVIGRLLGERLLGELFLTLSPRLAGRAPGTPRLALVEGFALPPDALARTELQSVKRDGSHLFLRYRLAN